jgi:hypothetical protein
MGALAGRSAGAIGYRDEIGSERGEPVDGVPQAALHLLGLGRKELKGNGWELWRGNAVLRGGRHLGHGSTNSTAALRTSGLAAVRQNKANASAQTAHYKWEIAQYLQLNRIIFGIFQKVGSSGRHRRERRPEDSSLNFKIISQNYAEITPNRCSGSTCGLIVILS